MTINNSSQIIGKVARILNSRELVINIGGNKGVSKDMRFKILSSETLKIKDPDTNDVLGSVDREKVRVKAIEVYEKFSICKTYRTRTVGINRSLISMAEMLTGPKTIPETLKADDSEYPAPLSEEQSYVKTGDPVISLSEGDEE